jgi:hypothetical protein
MARHWMFLTALGFFLGGLVLFAAWWVYGKLVLSQGLKGQIFRRRFHQLMPFSIRKFMTKDGGSYELLEREDEDHSA